MIRLDRKVELLSNIIRLLRISSSELRSAAKFVYTPLPCSQSQVVRTRKMRSRARARSGNADARILEEDKREVMGTLGTG